jgi:thiol-disulfide isomerase/thioredoxin
MRWRRHTLLAALVLACGCKGEEPSTRREQAAVVTTVSSPPTHPAAKPSLPVDVVSAPAEGEVAEIVQREVARAGKDGHHLLVYVGAPWCEPCQRFHEAAQKGELDASFPGLRLLEFNLDRDRERLQKAGYASRMIPLFALPRLDGEASGEQIEGGVKGTGAVDNIAPRLRALLDK